MIPTLINPNVKIKFTGRYSLILSIAVEELYTGAVRIVSDDEDLNEGEEA